MIYFLAPVFNEKDNLPIFYENIKRCMMESPEAFTFLFVNDGSTDGSLELLQDLKKKDDSIILLSHYPNLGIRHTFIDGFKEFFLRGARDDILITMEADNTFDEQVTSKMIEALKPGGYDVALASCYSQGGRIESTNLFRIFLSFAANLIVRSRFGLWQYHTFSSFNRGFRYDCLRKLFESIEPMTFDGFACVVEMLIKLHRMNFKIIEIPMTLRNSRRIGKSKMPVFKTIFEYFLLCLKI